MPALLPLPPSPPGAGTPPAPAGAPRPAAAARLPMGLFAEELFEARMRANWYESAAMSETNF